MAVMSSEWQERLNHWIETLKKDLYTPLQKLSWEACLTMDYLALDEARNLPYEKVETGFTWGNTWEYGWFRTTVTLPEEARGQRIVLDLPFGGEATLFVDGQAFGTYRADWVDEPHHFMVDNYLTRDGEPGRVYQIYVEVYAGHYFPVSKTNGGHSATGPVLPGDFPNPLTEGARRTLGVSSLGLWNEDAYQLYMDVKTLSSLLDEVLEESSLRAEKVAAALEQFTLKVDFEQERGGRIRDYQAAREILRPALSAVNGSTMPQFYAVGNAHIDLAWLWPMAETYRKTARTFAAQLRLLEEYPEYMYIQSQPAAYEMCREHYPELFDRILEAVKEGRWIPDGAMWVEPDTNMTSGESLVRQLLYGKKYYKEVFGVDSQVLWLPDTFGYTAALPQILQSCGVKYLVTQKIFWSYNGGEQFPYHYFAWEGMDGSRITTFLPTSYTYQTSPDVPNNVWKSRSQRRDLEGFLFPFGYGDGGGGPCRDHIEYVKRCGDLEGSVKMRMASPQQFFQDMDALGGPKHTYVGELYFTAHRGTYTSQAMVKRNNRRSERMMQELELWSTLADLKGAASYPGLELEKMWKEVLLHQFHDILPGSSIARVYEDAKAAYDRLFEKGESLMGSVLSALTEERQGVTLWNSLGFARTAVVTLPEAFRKGAVCQGNYVPVYGDTPQAVVCLPACGAVSLMPAEEAQESQAPVTLQESEEGFVFENSRVYAVLDREAHVASFRLKASDGARGQREFAAGPMNCFHLYKDVPRRYDAWDIDSNYVEQEILSGVSGITCRVKQREGAEAILSVEGTVGASRYTQEIVLSAESTVLEFRTHVDWQEKHRLLKVAFSGNVYADEGINEMQFGYVKRPTHRSRLYDQDRFEVCNHRYSALCDESHGVALLNDCKYGISMNGNALELTLLRASTCPDFHADQGAHDFTYGFTAWEGDFYGCDVVKQGYELNVKPLVTAGSTTDFSGFSVDSPSVILETIKQAEDGSRDLILRLYESKKADTWADLHMDLSYFGVRAEDIALYQCSMLEEKTEPVSVENGKAALHFRPFEVKTLRLTWKNRL